MGLIAVELLEGANERTVADRTGRIDRTNGLDMISSNSYNQ